MTIPGDRLITLTSPGGSQNTIHQAGAERHFIVSTDSSLTLEHIVLEGEGYTSEDSRDDNNGGIHINTGGTVTLGSGSVIRKCFARGGNGGGGVYVDGGALYLDGGIITDNRTHSWGAGILVKNSGSVDLDNGSEVNGNKAFWDGGGIRVESKSAVTVNGGSEISENNALHGGGICAQSETAIVLNDGKITYNTLDLDRGQGEGGGIRGDNAAIEIYGSSEVSHNEGYHGGGIFMRNGGSLTLKQGTIADNKANDSGGGVKCESTTVAVGDNAEIIGNKALNGGGIFAQYSADITIGEALITENEASGNGGGIYADNGELNVNSGGRITGNKAAEDGGGVRGTGGVTIVLSAGEVSRNQGKVGAGISANYGSEVILNIDSSITGNGSDNSNDGNIKTVRGGGVTMDGGTLTMNSGTISGNIGETGGGIYLYNNGSGVIAKNCLIADNTVTNGDGGGINADGWPVTLENVVVSGNTASNNGGGVFAKNCTVTLTKTTIEDNEAVSYDGGGIRGTNVTLDLVNSELSNNRGPNGAGMSMNQTSVITMDELSIVSSNNGSSRGGGVNIDSGTTFTLSGGTIRGNRAESGGGIISNGSTFTMTGGLITGNISDTDGGGLRLSNSQLVMENSTINQNEAPNGGGLSANNSSSIEMSVSTINQNGTVTGVRGGGVNLDQSTVFTMNSGEIKRNYAQSGGGVIASAGSDFIMKGGEIANNTSAYSGGGIRMESSDLFISAGVIGSNSAGYHGGGVYLTNAATLEMTGGSVTNNSSTADGGGIYTENLSYPLTADLSRYSNLKISGATISGNRSSAPQTPPVNALLFADFDGTLLTNDQINYYPSGIVITYISNGGSGGTVTETRGIDSNLPLQTIVDLEFSPPAGDYEFMYWSNEPGGTNAGGLRYKGDGITPVIFSSDMTLYAIWGPLAGTISGSVFLDSNSSGSYDSGELLEGITVTLHMVDGNGTIIDAGETKLTDADGRYEFRAEIDQEYKVFFQAVDSDSSGNIVGSAGFIAKGTGDDNSHINQDGFSDVIKLETARQAVTKNAGYAPPFIVTSGVASESVLWVLFVLLSGFVLAGSFAVNRRRRHF